MQNLHAYRLYLNHRVEIKGPDVRLRDIARIDGASNPEILEGKLIARNLQRPVYLPAGELQSRLNNGPESLERVHGVGVWIIPLNRTVSVGKLEEMIRDELKKLPDHELVSEIDIRLPEDLNVEVPTDGIEMRFGLPDKVSSLHVGERIIALDVYPLSDNPATMRDLLKRYQLPLTIRARRMVPVSNRDLPVGHQLTSEDFHLEERLFTENPPVGRTPAELIGKRVSTNVNENDVLSPDNIKLDPDVRRGQSIRLVYQTPGLIFRIRSVALREGATGEVIPVQPVLPSGQRSNRTLRARIVSTELAVIENE
ncbi:MAG: flagellar basal body P-ring formation protein FlgA [Leptospiraceae bacterium]|nr:flagellar basal body P-ring formation protein FlgA [Leptospiraceae bacterium]